MKQTKRILKIIVERLVDWDSDTSYLGEYASKATGDYSIDREHTLDCPVNNPHVTDPIVDKLERILRYLDVERVQEGNNPDSVWWEGLDAATDTLIEAQDAVTECDCDESGDRGRNEHRYFNTSGNYLGLPIEDIVQYTKQDYARMQSLHNQDWYYLGIGAKAEVLVGNVCQTVRSGGLYGIESDSEQSYLEEEEANQLAELRTVLYEMGFSKRAIATAVKEKERGQG